MEQEARYMSLGINEDGKFELNADQFSVSDIIVLLAWAQHTIMNINFPTEALTVNQSGEDN